MLCVRSSCVLWWSSHDLSTGCAPAAKPLFQARVCAPFSTITILPLYFYHTSTILQPYYHTNILQPFYHTSTILLFLPFYHSTITTVMGVDCALLVNLRLELSSEYIIKKQNLWGYAPQSWCPCMWFPCSHALSGHAPLLYVTQNLAADLAAQVCSSSYGLLQSPYSFVLSSLEACTCTWQCFL